MKPHRFYDTRSTTWLDNHDDDDVLTQAMVPPALLAQALALNPRPYPEGVQTWLEHLPYIHKPPLEMVKEKPRWIGMGLVLWGPSGRGKTIMAIHLLRDILRKKMTDADTVGRYQGAMLGAFFDWQALSEHFRAMAGGDESWEADRRENALRGHELILGTEPRSFLGGGMVVLDDLSRERATEFNLDRMNFYLRWRRDRAMSTIITTNHSPDQWDAIYGDVLGPYMRRAFITVEVS